MDLIYVGRHDAVEVDLHGGGFVVAQKGFPTAFPDDLAGSLLEQHENWQPAPAKKAKASAAVTTKDEPADAGARE